MFLQRGTFLRLYYRIIVCRDPPLCGWNQEVSCAALSVDLVSKSGFLLTADPWKIGSVSKSAFLLTASSRSECKRRKAAWMFSGTYPGYSGNDYAETRGIGFEEILFPQNS